MRIAVVGAGFFGLYIARFLSEKGNEVVVFEAEKEAMTRASYVNQARVHNGYHYPRSILTAQRSHRSFPIFCEDFRGCIVNDFEKYYAIANRLSNVTANQFARFCETIGARCDVAPAAIKKQFSPGMVEEVFSTDEFAFNYKKLREEILLRNQRCGTTVLCGCTVDRVVPCGDGRKNISLVGGKVHEGFDQVINCSYASINELNKKSGFPVLPLIHELTEMALIDLPEELKKISLTVMCGPFFSFMPFPSSGYSSLSHVRYTPNKEGAEMDFFKKYNNRSALDAISHSSWVYMSKDVGRYLPAFQNAAYVRSIWEVKTILPSSANDDSRPILFQKDYGGIPGYHCIMGGKIDNVYDAVECIEREVLNG